MNRQRPSGVAGRLIAGWTLPVWDRTVWGWSVNDGSPVQATTLNDSSVVRTAPVVLANPWPVPARASACPGRQKRSSVHV